MRCPPKVFSRFHAMKVATLRGAFVLTAVVCGCAAATEGGPQVGDDSSTSPFEGGGGSDVKDPNDDALVNADSPTGPLDGGPTAEVGDDAGADIGVEVADAIAKSDGGRPGTFVHPGILVQKGQLDFLKGKIAAGVEPWKSAFDKVKASRWASISYAAAPRAIVECGSYSVPDFGCSDEKSDVIAAYTDALIWSLTGDEAYAKKSIEIMNAWSAVLKDHTNSNAPLQSAWAASVFPRAADIIKATYSGWAGADVARFASMLKNVYLPKVIKGAPGDNGNWELSMAEATIAIGVFLDDRPTFDTAVSMWRKRVPAYIYLSSDGATPVPPPGAPKSGTALIDYWYKQSKLVDGVAQETCRDFGHLELGFSAMFNAAETARIQGVDLLGEESKRIAAGLEFNTQYLDGVPVPSWLCGGTLNALAPGDTWEIVYNALAGRLGVSLPHTKNVVTKNRPTGATHQMVWETLTHAEVGAVGLP